MRNWIVNPIPTNFPWEVDEVLYDLDGPKIFTFISGSLFLAYFCEEYDYLQLERFLVVPVSQEEISLLKKNVLDVQTVLSKETRLLMDLDYQSWSIIEIGLISLSEFSDFAMTYFPKPGIYLNS